MAVGVCKLDSVANIRQNLVIPLNSRQGNDPKTNILNNNSQVTNEATTMAATQPATSTTTATAERTATTPSTAEAVIAHRPFSLIEVATTVLLGATQEMVIT